MKCPICGSEMRVILCWPSSPKERGYICECCDLIGDKKKIAYQQKLVAAKELAAEKRGAEKERERVKPLVEAIKSWLIVKAKFSVTDLREVKPIDEQGVTLINALCEFERKENCNA